MDELDAVLSGVPPAPRSAPRRARRPAAPRSAPSAPPVSPEVGRARTNDLQGFVTSNGFELSPGRSGYATSGHNPGSLHGEGYAVDVRVRDRKPEEVDDFISKAKGAGYVVRDERTRPAGQSVWDGPHVHLEYDELGKVLADIPAQAPKDELDAVLSGVPDAEEVVTLNPSIERATGKPLALDDARRAYVPDATEQLPPLPEASRHDSRPVPQGETFDVRTMEGRARRDAARAAERDPSGRYLLEIELPKGKADWSEVTGNELARIATARAASRRGVPDEFIGRWMSEHGDSLKYYDLQTGREKQPVESVGTPEYDEERRTMRVHQESPLVARLVDDYKASRGSLKRLSDWASSDETSPGEKVLDVASYGAEKAAPAAWEGVRIADLATRPLQAIDAAFWARLRGANEIQTVVTAYEQFFGDNPELGKSVIAEALRNSDRLKAINPRLPQLLGELSNIILQPSNLIPLGAVGRLAQTGKLARVGEVLTEGARGLRLLDRGLVESRPLGLLEGAAAREAASAPDDALRAAGYTVERVAAPNRTAGGAASEVWKLTDADGRVNIMRDDAELADFAEGAAQSARGAVSKPSDVAGLNEARVRYEYHVEQAANAPSRAARENAQALADDYAKEIARLEGVQTATPEGFDVSSARFRPEPPDAATRPLWRRGLGTAKDVAQLPKAKAGFDLSATGRQGLPQAAAHPSYLKEAFAHQVKAFASEDAANDFAQAIRNRPDFELMNDSGLFLSSVGPEAEEAFASNLARRIPGVRASDRAYSAAMDSIRTQAWDNYASSLPAHLRDNPKTLKAVAELINISTGRGVVPILDRSALGKKVIELLNVPFFSPRNTASKFNLISPARIVKNMASAETRPVAYLQLRDASRGLASLGTTLGLLYLAGLDVGVDPRSSDFGKVRVGKAVYDLTGGEGYTVRYLARMARTAGRMAQGRQVKPRETLEALTRRYLRTQLQPLAAGVVDVAQGEDVQGRKVTPGSAALDLFVPFIVDDVIKGFQAEGLLGAAKAAPAGVLGVGVNFYDKPKEGRAGARPSPAEVQSNQLRLEGERESKNVEDLRDPDTVSGARYTAEDHRALVDERREAGEPEIDEAQAGAVALMLDSIPERDFGSYAKSLDEAYELGRVGEAATYAGEYASKGIARSGLVDEPEAYERAAEAQEFLRALAREKRLRPTQFYFDAAAGRYGSRLRDEVLEGIYYPENHPPSSPLKLDGILEPAAPPPAPESPETLRQQFKSAGSEDSPRVGVLMTSGERLRRVPRGFARLALDDGTLYLNRRKLKAAGVASRAALKEFIARNGFEPLIGKVAPVADTSKGMALRTEDARGVELSTSIVPDANAAAAQAAEDLAQFPEAARQELGTAQEMVARRLAPASPEHAELRRRVDAASPDAKPTFVEFDEGAGTLRVPREAMPQVKSQHRGAMVNYLRGRGIAHSLEEVPAGELLPSQAEWSPEKVARALAHEGAERRILISSDDHVADGHHQWLGAVYEDPALTIPVIRLDAPIARLLLEMARFPSSYEDEASARAKG